MNACAVDWVMVLQIVSAVGAVLAAIAAAIAAREAKKSTHAQLLMDLMAIENSLEHKRAMARLVAERLPEVVAALGRSEAWVAQQLGAMHRDTALARVLDLAGRVFQLHSMGLINDRIVRGLFLDGSVEAMLAVPEFAELTPEIHTFFSGLYPEAARAALRPVPPADGNPAPSATGA